MTPFRSLKKFRFVLLWTNLRLSLTLTNIYSFAATLFSYTFLNFEITSKNTIIIIIQTASNQPASNAAPTQPVNPTAKPEKHSAKPNPSSPALTQ
jgi:hypothetical protein